MTVLPVRHHPGAGPVQPQHLPCLTRCAGCSGPAGKMRTLGRVCAPHAGAPHPAGDGHHRPHPHRLTLHAAAAQGLHPLTCEARATAVRRAAAMTSPLPTSDQTNAPPPTPPPWDHVAGHRRHLCRNCWAHSCRATHHQRVPVAKIHGIQRGSQQHNID